MTTGKFEVYEDKSGQYRFRLKAANGGIIAVGEASTPKAACMNGIESVKKNAPTAATGEVKRQDTTVFVTGTDPHLVLISRSRYVQTCSCDREFQQTGFQMSFSLGPCHGILSLPAYLSARSSLNIHRQVL